MLFYKRFLRFVKPFLSKRGFVVICGYSFMMTSLIISSNLDRVVSIFCFARSLAMDCKKRQDSSIFIEMIPDIVAKEAFPRHIVDWIISQDGWSGILNYTKKK